MVDPELRAHAYDKRGAAMYSTEIHPTSPRKAQGAHERLVADDISEPRRSAHVVTAHEPVAAGRGASPRHAPKHGVARSATGFTIRALRPAKAVWFALKGDLGPGPARKSE